MSNLAESVSSADQKEVRDRLDTIITLLLSPVNRDRDQPSGLQGEIFGLCDYDHTTEEIRDVVKKTLSHVKKELSLLRSKGMVRTVKRDGRLVHIRIP